VEQAILSENDRVKVLKSIPDNADAVMRFINDGVLREIVTLTPNETINLIWMIPICQQIALIPSPGFNSSMPDILQPNLKITRIFWCAFQDITPIL